MNLRKFLMILTIALVIILAIVVWFSPSDEDFRTENPFWNGIKDIRSSYPVSPLESLSGLPPSPEGSTLILIPYLRLNPAELEMVNYFVSGGGTLILADDYGYGNHLLTYLGLKARFSGQPLLDPLANYKNQWFPRISHFKDSSLTNNVDSLVFNHATCLNDVEAADILARSSSFSFLDVNGNGTHDETEPTGPLPVISRHTLGNGQVVLVSDPSLFINSMKTTANNDSLMRNIAATAPSSLFIDQSHLPPSNLSQTKNQLNYIYYSFLATRPGIFGLVIVALTITLMPLWRERRRH